MVKRSLADVWNAAPSDPDSHVDLDYELQRLAVVKLDERMDRAFVIAPTDGDDDHERAFILADPGSVCRLDECR